MFRDLGRVHIVSFAVGIVGLAVGITGIVLAIVFGTAQSTCTTPSPPPVCPTCPTQTAQCNTNLFSISTQVNNLKWNDDYNNTNSPAYIDAVKNITSALTATLNTGLNTASSSGFYRVLAVSTTNNVNVQISALRQGSDNSVVAIGNGAISSTSDLGQMPTDKNVNSVITSDNTTYSDVTTAPQACDKTIIQSDCPSTVAPVTCSTMPMPTTQPLVTSTAPEVTTTVAQTTTAPIVTTANTTTQGVTTTAGVTTTVTRAQNSTLAATTTAPSTNTTTQGVTTTVGKTTTVTTAQNSTWAATTTASNTTTQPVVTTSTSTQGISTTTAQATPSSSVIPTTTQTTQRPTSTGIPSTVSTSQGTSSTSPIPSTTQTSSSAPSTYTSNFTPSPTTTLLTSTIAPSTQGVPTSTSPSTTGATSTASPSTITSSAPTSQSHSPSSTMTSTVPVTSTFASTTTTVPITVAPGQCYCQSNVAVAFELTSGTSDLDLDIQNFIANYLFFYSGAPYILGDLTDNRTAISLVPFPNDDTLSDLMTYGAEQTPSGISAALDTFNILARGNAVISDAFNIIPNITRKGYQGFVILVANSDESVQASVDSATNLKAQGFNVITVAFKSSGKFDVLASQPSYNYTIVQDADKRYVATLIGNVLNTTYCNNLAASSTTMTSGVYSSTVTVTTQGSSSQAPSSTVTVPTTGTTSGAASTTGSITSTQQATSTSSVITTGSTSAPQSSTAVSSTTTSPSTTTGSTPAPQSSTVASTTTVSPYTTTECICTTVSNTFGTSTTQGLTSSSAQSTASTGVSTVASSTTIPQGSSSSSPQSPTSAQPAQSSSTSAATVTVSSSQSPTSSPAQQSSTPAGSSTVTVQQSSSFQSPQSTTQIGSSTTVPSTQAPSSTSGGPTTTQICPNQQTVFKGQVGVIYEMLPASTQQNAINAFVENVLLNSNFYGLALDNLTHDNRTLVTAIPYPTTDKYNVQGYGSARSVDEFRNQVIAFNGMIQPISQSSSISDALLYVTTSLPAGGVKSSLIIVGNSAAMIDNIAPILTNQLRSDFDIYTVGVGSGAVDLSPLSSGTGFSFTGDTQQVADQIGLKMASSNPSVYCPPPVPSTAAPSTSTAVPTTTVPVTTTIATTTRVTTVRPTVGPCQCTGRWVYNGDLAIAFENIKTNGSQSVANFLSNTLLKNPDSYGLTNDVNGNQPSQLTLIPYPDSNTYPTYPYGWIRSVNDIGNYIDAISPLPLATPDPQISDALTFISAQPTTLNSKVVLLVGSNGTDVNAAMDSANKLKNAGYLVITVAQTAAASVFQPLASGSQFALHIGDGNDDAVAAQIASMLLDYSFTCFDDGSSTPSPTTRCPGTQGTTQPGTIGTTVTVPPSSSSIGSTAPQGSSSIQPIASSSTMGSTAGSSSPQPTVSSTSVPSSTGATSSGSSTTVGSSTVGATQTSVSSSTVPNTGSTGSTVTNPSTSSSTSGSSSTQSIPSSTAANTGSSTSGPTVATTQGSSSTQTNSNTGSTTVATTVTQGSSTGGNSGSTTVNFQSSSVASTVASSTANIESSTTPIPTCASPYSGKIATVFELNANSATNIVNFVSNNLYNSANYDFTNSTEAINVPYGQTDHYATQILQYNGTKSLSNLQDNVSDLLTSAILLIDATISDGLQWLQTNRDPAGTNAVIIVVGNDDDENPAMTTFTLRDLRAQGYKVISVAVGEGHGDFSPIPDKPEWYFQVNDSNGQNIADQISSILCNLK
ncbi:VWFA domain-containing protein [Caenorhabditis elegans]|uniref:VWFA domain-containing protein n=1 Tax=Caenorhabditis elegans TaxID=6239 RepID=A0A2C9C355_CAEEL|nr:VWFA domain-containing protein [Caenorhabditis elegans]SOF58776.1 VWFA domain-containing protein [Caenorhabditis elegans]|eukprot:NP_001343784.1 Uncharacterized protein CELE_T19D12.1 [Caenorhabditis elegans]